MKSICLHSRMTMAAFCLLATGCMTVGPDYEKPQDGLPAAYRLDGSTSGSSTVGNSTASPLIQNEWWKLYGDARLNQLIASALERNADIRVAVARIEETDANLREVGAAFLPEVNLGASGSRQRISTTTATPFPAGASVIRNNVRLALNSSFEIDFWGRLARTQEAARAVALGSRYAKEVVALSLTGLTAQAYFSLRSLDEQIAFTRATLAGRDAALDLARKRGAGGIASDLDLGQAQSARADASLQLRELMRQRALLEHQLATLTGTLDLGIPQGELPRLPVPPLPPAGLPSQLLERRPDIAQAEQLLIAANAQIGIARAAMLPSVSLTGAFGDESRALSSLLNSGSRIWSLGFGLTLPIFDWGRLAARSDAAEARAHQLVAGYQKAVETAFREVADALTNAAVGSEAEEDLQIRAQAARNTARLAQLRYESGYSPFLEVLDAQRTLNDAELAVVRNRQTRLAASVDFMKALGGGWAR
jgi:multidrug efflux system outer membrane protein